MIAAKLIPWFVPTETESRAQIASELAQRLEQKPDETLCLVAIERNITRAIVIAHVSEKYRKTVWAWQARAEPGFRYSEIMFDALKGWTKAKGCRRIRTAVTDERVAKLHERKYGFNRDGQEMYCNVA